MIYSADFETTTETEDCRVWAWGMCSITDIDSFMYGNTIESFIETLSSLDKPTIYFHNLRFDGEFIVSHLLTRGFTWKKESKTLTDNTFTTLISDKGVWYSIEIKIGNKRIKILDSLKVLPFKVSEIAKTFKLKDQKLEIDYKEKREKGHELTNQEILYLRNDVVIVAQALKILFDQGLTRMTIGGNAIHNYKKDLGESRFKHWFPTPTYDLDIRGSYKGGFTYANDVYRNQDIGKGIVLDVNSLYPSVMRFCPMPYGEGIFYEGKYKYDPDYPLFIQMFRCCFDIKKDKIPTIQIKRNEFFKATEYQKSSEGLDVTLCLTSVDLEIFLEHYDVYDIEWFSGWKFKSSTQLFCNYIDKWNDVKVKATEEGNGGLRAIAKLMLNNLYGKFATNPKGKSKIPYLNEDGILQLKLGEEEEREAIYIPVGTFITAWARHKTITSAQKVFDRFLYADTDSLHLIGTDIPSELSISPTNLGEWKHEGTFTRARYLRSKSYMEEFIVDEIEAKKLINNGQKVELINNEWHHLKITCAGMPTTCYKYVTWDNFRLYSEYPGKLKPTHVPGGIILSDTTFTIRK